MSEAGPEAAEEESARKAEDRMEICASGDDAIMANAQSSSRPPPADSVAITAPDLLIPAAEVAPMAKPAAAAAVAAESTAMQNDACIAAAGATADGSATCSGSGQSAAELKPAHLVVGHSCWQSPLALPKAVARQAAWASCK